MRHVIFRLDRDRYALPLDAVREVVNAPEQYSRVPRTKDAVKGVMTRRGRVVPVVDLARLLGLSLQPAGPGAGGKVVLLELVRRELGLLVTEVEGIEGIEKGGKEARSTRLVRGLARVGPLTVTVLDLEGIDSAIAAAFT